MKRHTACNRCGRKGHWARECRSKEVNKKGSGKGASSSSKSNDASTTGIAAVEELDFVASVVPQLTLLEQVRQKRQDSLFASHPLPEETLLVSSPGYAVLDSGCGRTIVGINTLRCFGTLWRQRGWAVPP